MHIQVNLSQFSAVDTFYENTAQKDAADAIFLLKPLFQLTCWWILISHSWVSSTRTSVSFLSSESCPGIQHRPFARKKRVLQASTVSFPQALLGAFVLLQHAGALQQALPQVLPHPPAGPPVLLLLLVVLGHGGSEQPPQRSLWPLRPSPPPSPPPWGGRRHLSASLSQKEGRG